MSARSGAAPRTNRYTNSPRTEGSQFSRDSFQIRRMYPAPNAREKKLTKLKCPHSTFARRTASFHFDDRRPDRCLWLDFWHEANFDTLVAGATNFLLIGIRNSSSGNEFGRDAIANERLADRFKARLCQL